MQITPDVHTGRGRRRTLFPKLPLSPRQYRWLSLLIFLAVPLVSFGIVEILNYNNPFTSFTPLQVALNLVWYYLGEAFFYFLRGGRPVAAAKWSLGFAWGLGMANHYIISFRGRTLFPGDLLTLRDLLYGLMLPSGNDSAVAIAEYVGGTEENFMEMVNEEAQNLMATGTHFVTPNGLHDEDHYTTAYDMYLIFNEAVKYDEFVDIISADSYTAQITGADGAVRSVTWEPTSFYA